MKILLQEGQASDEKAHPEASSWKSARFGLSKSRIIEPKGTRLIVFER